MYGPPKPSAVDQMPSDRSRPMMDVRLLKRPRSKKIAIAVSVAASKRAKSNGLALIRVVQKEIHAWISPGWPSFAPET